MKTRDWTVRHELVPNVANPGIGGDEDDEHDKEQEREHKQEQHDKGDGDEEIEKDGGRMRWGPSLESIAEEL